VSSLGDAARVISISGAIGGGSDLRWEWGALRSWLPSLRGDSHNPRGPTSHDRYPFLVHAFPFGCDEDSLSRRFPSCEDNVTPYRLSGKNRPKELKAHLAAQ
jgi:hypothetical protein